MKMTFFFVAFMALVSPARSEDAGKTIPQERVAPPIPARILGDIPDGTPPPPAPPKPAFVVPARDILATTTQEQGGRTITIRKIKPIALPAPPAPPPAANTDNAAFRERLAECRASHPVTPVLSLGATVYRFKDFPPRTLVQYWPGHGDEPITFWSSADFALISGIHSFVGTDGLTYSLFMTWSTTDTTRSTATSVPNIPVFPDGPASFAIVGTPPADSSVLGPIQSLHDLYNSEFQRLMTAYEGRERARLQHEADLKANPPKPKNIVLNYWRTEKPAQTEGGNK